MTVMRTLAVLLMLMFVVPAHAKIPDFGVGSAPDIIKKSTNPKAREFYSQLVEHAKAEARRMVADTSKTTGLKAGDLKKVDWDCLFWRVAATNAKNIRRRFPGLQPPEFADWMERTALDDDDCPDEGGPGSNGVRVYETAINQVQAGRDGWQRSSEELDWVKALFGAAAVGVGNGAPAGAAVLDGAGAASGLVPIVNPEVLHNPVKPMKDGT
jgi:hypothetical protein